MRGAGVPPARAAVLSLRPREFFCGLCGDLCSLCVKNQSGFYRGGRNGSRRDLRRKGAGQGSPVIELADLRSLLLLAIPVPQKLGPREIGCELSETGYIRRHGLAGNNSVKHRDVDRRGFFMDPSAPAPVQLPTADPLRLRVTQSILLPSLDSFPRAQGRASAGAG